VPRLAAELKAPVMLLAMPQVLDPFFHRGAVLLLHHDDDGSFGFIVNRPTEIKVVEILRGMEIEWSGDPQTLAYFGGPVQPQLGTVLFSGGSDLLADDQGDPATEVTPGVRMTNHIQHLAQLAATPPDRFRLILGYAGWGSGQLVGEILRNDWLTAPVDNDLVFSPDADGIWSSALASVGVDPAALPAWTPPAGEDETN
jgi:putative transcriptional regulator